MMLMQPFSSVPSIIAFVDSDLLFRSSAIPNIRYPNPNPNGGTFGIVGRYPFVICCPSSVKGHFVRSVVAASCTNCNASSNVPVSVQHQLLICVCSMPETLYLLLPYHMCGASHLIQAYVYSSNCISY